MAQPRTSNGSTTSMPDIGIPGHSRSQTSRLTPEERIQAIEAARVERDTLVAILEEKCREIEQLVNNRGRRSILKHLKTQIHSHLEQDMIHNVVPSDVQRHAFLKQLLTTEVRSYIAEYLDNPSTFIMLYVSFGSFHGQDPQFQSTTVCLTVRARERTLEADLKQVSSVPIQYLKLPCPPKELMEIRSRYPNQKVVKLVDVGEPIILIGAENQWLHLRLDEKLPPVGTDAPFGLLMPFGWTCVGDLTVGAQQHASANQPRINWRGRNWKRLFNSMEPSMNALCRLFSIENKFAHNSNFAERYKAVIGDYVEKGFAWPLKESELNCLFGRNWYLPHHGVVNPRKPEKFRVVLDASAKYQGVALNERKAGVPICGYSTNVSSSWHEEKRSLRPIISMASTWLWQPWRKRPTVYEMQRQIFGSPFPHPLSSDFKCSDILLTYFVKNFLKLLKSSTRTSMWITFWILCRELSAAEDFFLVI
ncbi:Uncharacterized protein APZ42_025417 [Daphnia magna]|uniref:Uncharacterized protein n=1 Tax=Daphnia magna TaxID=35525 RepID=A0A164T3T8_9CRUS|nr:Uncharacterized protein APZ42_025417 [Daphnia magna]